MTDKRKPFRCSECGYPWRGSSLCPRHPDADSVAWGSEMKWAYHYVTRESESGRDLDEFVQRPGEYLTGVTPGDLAMALMYARLWQERHFHEGELPTVVTPNGLYG